MANALHGAHVAVREYFEGVSSLFSDGVSGLQVIRKRQGPLPAEPSLRHISFSFCNRVLLQPWLSCCIDFKFMVIQLPQPHEC